MALEKEFLNKTRLFFHMGYIFFAVVVVIIIYNWNINYVQAVTWITPTEITPGSASTWTDADVSSYVSGSATGVILHAVNNNSSNLSVGYRKNGSTDARTTEMYGSSHHWAAIGVDGSQILELYVANTTDQDIYIVGYFESEASFFTNAVDKSLSSTGSWQDIDISSDTGGDTAVGAILELIQPAVYNNYGLRMNGSTDTMNGRGIRHHNGFIVGVDGSEIFEGYIQNVAADFFLVGYITSGATFNTNATDIGPASSNSWQDLTSLPAGATGGFIEVYRYGFNYGLRKNGSSEDIKIKNPEHAFGMVEASSQVIEGYSANISYLKFYLLGYTTAAAPSNNAPTISSVTDSPDPVAAGADVYWNVDWNDADSGEMIKVVVCSTNSITTSTLACGATKYCQSPVYTNRDPEGLCSYTTQTGDIGTLNYYTYVCDDSGDATTACSNSTSGSVTVQEQNPTAPTDLLLENMPNPVNIATTSPRFSAVFNDPNIGDIANKYCIHVNTASDFSGTDMWLSDGAGCGTGNSMTNCTQGNRCLDIYYQGSALTLDQTVYYWRINYWDDSGNLSASSTTGNFTMANQGLGARLQGGNLQGGIRVK